jgi:Phosphotransferase system, mannose/fructose/N-acetylgalactosamine-specific component IIC
MAQSAILLVLVYWFVIIVDTRFLSWQCLNRPIVTAPLAGLVLGDFRTGIIMGASLESIFMGISAIGGTTPADATTASIIAVAYTVLTGGGAAADIETGLAIALPIGTMMSSFNSLLSPFFSSLAPYWENLALKNMNSFMIQNILFTVFITPLAQMIVLFVAVSYGIEGLNAVLTSLPSWVIVGLGASSTMMLAVGFAILTSMIWSADVAIYFFVGYALTAYVGLGSVPIAIFGAAIAVSLFMGEKRLIDLKNSLGADPNKKAKAEEDFF